MLRALSLLAVAFVVACGLTAAEPQPQYHLRSLESLKKPWTGDLDKMLERGIVRVLVPYGRTLFYHDRGAERGVTVEAVRAFEKYLNVRFRNERRVPISVAILATTRDKLFDDLAAGRGDIAAGNITITDERRRDVDFSVPVGPPFSEIVVTSESAPQIASLEDLSGREVHVRKATSFYASLMALNQRLSQEGKPAIIVTPLPDELEDEDVLEMLNADLIQISVKDDWVANLWADTLPHMRLYPALRLREGQAGWAFRKDSPLLAAEVNHYVTSVMNKTRVSHASILRFAENAAKMHNARAAADWQVYQEVVALFRKYAAQYHFDYLLLSAQGYQESHLRQAARSGVGAVGIMQLMPATAISMHVGDINVVEANIHAGVKYMDFLMSHFLDDPALNEQNRTLFALAAYNAGPSRLPRLRAEAARLGLDPNRWLNNVELVVADRIGLEPVLYVRNIYKYYAAYVLATEAAENRNRAKDSVKPSR